MKWPSKVVHTPSALKPSSRVRRAITVSDTVMFAVTLSCAVEHHTASPQSICHPDNCYSPFHALAVSWRHRDDPAVVREEQKPKIPVRTSCVGKMQQPTRNPSRTPEFAILLPVDQGRVRIADESVLPIAAVSSGRDGGSSTAWQSGENSAS